MVRPPKEQAVNNTVNQEQDTEQNFVITEITKVVQDLLKSTLQEQERADLEIEDRIQAIQNTDVRKLLTEHNNSKNPMFEQVATRVNVVLKKLFGKEVFYLDFVKDLPKFVPNFDEKHIFYSYQLCACMNELQKGYEIYGEFEEIHCYYTKYLLDFFQQKNLSLHKSFSGEEHILTGLLAFSMLSNHFYYTSLLQYCEQSQILNLGDIQQKSNNIKTIKQKQLGDILNAIIGDSDNGGVINNKDVSFEKFFTIFVENNPIKQQFVQVNNLFHILKVKDKDSTFQAPNPNACLITELNAESMQAMIQYTLKRIDNDLKIRYFSEENIAENRVYYRTQRNVLNGNRSRKIKGTDEVIIDKGYGRSKLFRTHPISHTLKMIADVIKSYGDGKYDKDKLKKCLDAQDDNYLGIRHEKSMVKDAIMYGYFKRKSKDVSEIEREHWHFWCEVARRLFG